MFYSIRNTLVHKITNKSIRELLGGIYKASVSCGRKESLFPTTHHPRAFKSRQRHAPYRLGKNASAGQTQPGRPRPACLRDTKTCASAKNLGAVTHWDPVAVTVS